MPVGRADRIGSPNGPTQHSVHPSDPTAARLLPDKRDPVFLLGAGLTYAIDVITLIRSSSVDARKKSKKCLTGEQPNLHLAPKNRHFIPVQPQPTVWGL